MPLKEILPKQLSKHQFWLVIYYVTVLYYITRILYYILITLYYILLYPVIIFYNIYYIHQIIAKSFIILPN